MIIQVNVKKISKKISKVEPCPFEIEGTPDTLKGLISAMVLVCVNSYNKKLLESDKNSNKPLSDEEISNMAYTGKIGFGIVYSDKTADFKSALDNALTGFEDGLYRVFLDGKELENLNEKISLNENSELTLIRLTMLAGRMW